MNIQINEKTKIHISLDKDNNENIYKKDSIIKGEIISISKGYVNVLLDNKKEVRGTKSQIQGSINDSVLFEVIENNKNVIALKQKINNPVIKAENKELDLLKEFNKSNSNYIDEEDKDLLQEKIDENIKLVQLKRKLEHSKNNVNQSAVATLVKNGMDINKVPIDVFSVAIKNNKEISKEKKMDNELEKVLKEYGINNNEDYETISRSVEKLEQIQNNNENINKEQIIKKDQEVTLNNIRISKEYKNLSKDSHIEDMNIALGKGNIDELIKSHLSKKEIESNENNLEISSIFIKSEIPITKSNIDKWKFMSYKINNIDKKTFVKNSIVALQDGEHIGEIDLRELKKEVNPLFARIEEVRKNLNTEMTSFDVLKKEGKEITLENIIKYSGKNSSDEVNKENIKNRKLLLEIQLKLTKEVSYSLARRGIEIDTKPLEQAIEEIRKVEQKENIDSLKLFKVEPTSKNINSIIEVRDKLRLSVPLVNETYKKILEKNIKFNINDIYKNSNYKKLEDGYKEMETTVNIRLKDSFKKVEKDIKPLLDELNIESTKLNIKATSILVKNKIDVTRESIKEISLIDLKVEKLLKQFKPEIIAKMLKDNINPLTTNIDDILKYVEKFQEKYGFSNDDNLIKSLIKLEKDNTVSEKQLEGIKNIYKGINIVLKNDGAGIGNYFNTKKSLTIENLLNSSKIFNKTKGRKTYMDKTIDENNGEKEIIKNDKSIRGSIENLLNKEMTKQLIKSNSYENIRNMVNKNGIIEKNITIEKLYDDVLENNNNMLEKENYVDEIVKFTNSLEKENYNWLYKNNIEITVNNLENIKNLLKDQFSLDKKLKKETLLNKNIKDKRYNINNSLKEAIEVDSVLDEIIGEVKNTYMPEQLDKLEIQRSLIKSLEFQNELNRGNNNFYQMPIMLPASGEETILNMYLLDKDAFEKKEIELVFSLDTKKQGNLNIITNINKEKNTIDLNIKGNNLDIFKDNEQEFKNIFHKRGFEIVNLSLIYDDKYNENIFNNKMNLL